MCRDEDDRNVATLGPQSRLELKTRHSRHTDIRDETCGLVLLPELRNSSADAKACAGKSTACSKSWTALRIESSSSTIAMSLVVSWAFIMSETYQRR